MTRLIALLTTLGLFLAAGPVPVEAAGRAALVIGINDYAEVTDLEKAVGDARAMATRLRAMGFAVTEVLDADRRTLNRAISGFGGSLAAGDTAFVHFSGHGVEIDGENYLLPADIPAPASGQRDFIKAEAIAMTDLIARVAASGARARVFVIDACRDNPFAAAGVRSLGGTRGLARVEAPAGTFIMYSAGYSQQALDRLGPDDREQTSVYTRTLLKHLGNPGKAIDDIAQDVRREVEQMARAIGHEQRPAYYDELSARLVLVAGDAAQPPQQQADGQTAVRPFDEAAQAWAATKDSSSIAVLEAFVARFRGTLYGDLAAARLEELKQAGKKTDVAAVDPTRAGTGVQSPQAKPALPASATWRPKRQVTLIVPGAPGGGYDIQARTIAQVVNDGRLAPVPFVVVNKPGAGGAVAHKYVQDAADADHTILVGGNDLFDVPLRQGASVRRYLGQFAPIALFGTSTRSNGQTVARQAAASASMSIDAQVYYAGLMRKVAASPAWAKFRTFAKINGNALTGQEVQAFWQRTAPR